MKVHSDATERSTAYRQWIEEVEAWFHHQWLWRYPLKWASAASACAHFSGYFSMKWASMRKAKYCMERGRVGVPGSVKIVATYGHRDFSQALLLVLCCPCVASLNFFLFFNECYISITGKHNRSPFFFTSILFPWNHLFSDNDLRCR